MVFYTQSRFCISSLDTIGDGFRLKDLRIFILSAHHSNRNPCYPVSPCCLVGEKMILFFMVVAKSAALPFSVAHIFKINPPEEKIPCLLKLLLTTITNSWLSLFHRLKSKDQNFPSGGPGWWTSTRPIGVQASTGLTQNMTSRSGEETLHAHEAKLLSRKERSLAAKLVKLWPGIQALLNIIYIIKHLRKWLSTNTTHYYTTSVDQWPI